MFSSDLIQRFFFPQDLDHNSGFFFRCEISSLFHSIILTYFCIFVCLVFWYHYIVPLKNEIELAKAYVEIEKARFEERLEVVFEVPEDLEVNVPRLMLQPLIENAIIHGILPKPEGGKIDVLVKQEAKQLVFKVNDNGIGMDTKKLLDILKQEKGNGVGIANIDSRLKKLYGKGLEIQSSHGEGTEVTWNIPLNGRGN